MTFPHGRKPAVSLASQPHCLGVLEPRAKPAIRSPISHCVFDTTQARRPATPNKRWLAPHATAATARARPRARASCSSAPLASPTSCRAAERRIVRGVQSGGRGVGRRGVGSGAQLLRERAWQRGPRTSDVRYGPIAASCVLNLKVGASAYSPVQPMLLGGSPSASNSLRKGKFEGNSIDWDYGFTYDDSFSLVENCQKHTTDQSVYGKRHSSIYNTTLKSPRVQPTLSLLSEGCGWGLDL